MLMFDVNKECSSQLVTMEQYINNRDPHLLLRISVDMEVIKRVKDVEFTHFLFTTINANIRNYLTDSSLSMELKYTSGNYIMLSSILSFLDNLEEFDEDDEIEAHGNLQSLKKYNLCINCGRITEYSEKIHSHIDLQSDK